ncbi:DEAD/DEAH box helicase [Lapidilactobacillus gannanensis]|uniref:DEAD/DEAH box helicase n=1 Tax=Lapidilactobacillus gannanensis TaxID=2486002 RepID=A0ABW4BNY8_9LACO|nr:DEAD/DEAH box helicase [Lapidilactobacillus gannanensis]
MTIPTYQQPITPFLKIWQQSGFKTPTPIQQGVYWPIKQGQPVLGLAATGKGKTLAFGLPLLETLQPGEQTQLIILEPSAELVIQVRDVLQPYAQQVQMSVQGIVGKANLQRQLATLKKHPEVIVATVGRLTELLDRKAIKADRITSLVIDEADLQLDEEHREDTRQLIGALPAETQMILMSATSQPIFTELEKWFGYEFERIDTREQDAQQQHIAHDFVEVGNHYKAEFLKQLARGPLNHTAALVFVKNRGSAKTLAKTLTFYNLKVGLLLGDETSQQRQRVMQQFRRDELTYLVTTELAARGLDFAELQMVVNYDLPNSLTNYIHRAGRTGRMGRPGVVLNLGNDHDRRNLQHLLAGHYQLSQVYLTEKQLQTEKPVAKPEKMIRTAQKWSIPKSKKDQPLSESSSLRKKAHKKNRLRNKKNIGKPHKKLI